MYTVVRHYKDAPALIDELERHKADIDPVIREVPGLIAWYLVRAGNGGFTVTVCADQAGVKESTTVAADWIRHNVTGVTVSPEIIEGEAIAPVNA